MITKAPVFFFTVFSMTTFIYFTFSFFTFSRRVGEATVFKRDRHRSSRRPICRDLNLNDEAEMESDPVKVISDDSGSDAEDIDIEH